MSSEIKLGLTDGTTLGQQLVTDSSVSITRENTTYEQFIGFLETAGIVYTDEYRETTQEHWVDIDASWVIPYGCVCMWVFNKDGSLNAIMSE